MSCVEENDKSEDETTWIFSNSYSNSEKLEIRSHSRSLLRFTYRSHFQALAPYTYTTDAGWGCMLRSAQMLIGQTMQRHYLGRDWRIPNTNLRNNKDYCKIVRWCTDHQGSLCIYAIHHIVQYGMEYDKLPGEWYGPSTASLVLRDLTRLHRRKYQGPIEAHVTSGDSIYITEVEKTFTAIKRVEFDHFLEDEVEETWRRSKGRKSKHNRQCSSADTVDVPEHPKKPVKSGSSRREEANLRVIPERSVASLSSSLESHYRDVEDEANSFTQSVSSESQNPSRCHSVSSVTYDEDGGDDNTPHDMSAGPPLEPNPFTHKPGTPLETLKEKETTPMTGSDTEFRTLLSAVRTPSDSGLHVGPLPPPPVPSGGLTRLIAENLAIHDPLLNPPTLIKEEEWPASLLLLLPLRLGLDKFNPMYIPALKEFLRHRNSVGILGGQVNRAIYFVGYRGNTLLGMDPHTVYKTPSLKAPFPCDEYIKQIHCSDLHELNFNLLDPSLSLAFYFHDRHDFKTFCDETKFLNEQGRKTGRVSLYNVQHTPAATEFNMDMSGLCDSDSDDAESDDSEFKDDEYVFI